MVATIVTHMMISLNNHVGRAPNTNANFKKVATVQQFENVTELKYRSVIEQEQQPPAGSQAYQYSLNEPAITISEVSLTRVKNAVRTISEPAKAITESLVKKVTRAITEPAKAITENLVKVKKANRPITEPASAIGDSLNRIAHKVRTISEPATTIGESLTKSKKSNRTINESAIAITDSLAKHTIKVREITEPHTNISETLIHIRGAELSEAPITITESLQANRIFARSLSERVFISGTTASLTPQSFTNTSFTSTLSSTENLTKTVTHNISQTTAITENLLKVRIAVRNLSETVPLQPEIVQRLVTHYLNEPATAITESFTSYKTHHRTIVEPPTTITELLTVRRAFVRSINPDSFTDASFTRGLFESFRMPSPDAVEITEELEGFILPPGVFNLIEPAIDITESLVSHKTVFRTITEDPITIGESLTGIIPVPIPTTGGGGANRRRIRRARYNAYLRTLQPIKILVPPPEPEHEPLIFEIDISETPIQIQESLTAVKIIKEKVTVPIPVISQAASTPPQIIEKEKIVYVDRIVEKEIQPPPIIRAQDVIISKPQPIETNQEILVSTQSHSNKMKSKAASTRLQILQELMTLAEMEGMV